MAIYHFQAHMVQRSAGIPGDDVVVVFEEHLGRKDGTLAQTMIKNHPNVGQFRTFDEFLPAAGLLA